MVSVSKIVLVGLLCGSSFASATRFPPNASVVSVKDYEAKGDGVTDDTKAIQTAVNKNIGSYRYLYFPAGTYLVSKPIEWKFDTGFSACANENKCWGNGLSLIGEDENTVTIRLKDNLLAYQNKNTPQSVFITSSGPYSAASTGVDAFGNSILNLTIDVGLNNPGSEGIDYLATNLGAVRDVRIVSRDGKGYAGISMTRATNGPCLLKNIEITGFDFGIKAGVQKSSFTVENAILKRQAVAGVYANGTNAFINNLSSENSVAAIDNRGDPAGVGPTCGFMVLINSNLQGGTTPTAVFNRIDPVHPELNRPEIFCRNVKTTGYANAVSSGGTVLPGGTVPEFSSNAVKSLWPWPSELKSMNLPIEQTPEYWDNDFSHWYVLPPPSTAAVNKANIQAALQSGKTTLFFRPGAYDLDATIELTGGIRHLLGNGTTFNPVSAFSDPLHPKPLFLVNHSSPSLTIQNIAISSWNSTHNGLVCIAHNSSHSLILKDVLGWDDYWSAAYQASASAGNLYIENVSTQLSSGWFFARKQKIWARQFNPEDKGRTRIVNDGATLWILGLKTERRGTIIHTKNGGSTELLGAYFLNWDTYTQPALINENANVSASFFISSDQPEFNYKTNVLEVHGSHSRELTELDIPGNPYQSMVPLYVGYLNNAVEYLGSLFK